MRIHTKCVRKLKEKEDLGKLSADENNIKIDLKEMARDNVDWIHLA
jgi:hypothetical protein